MLNKHYIGYCLDSKVLEVSSSGGMFTVFARKIFELGGCVFGAIFNWENCEICHAKAENENELKLMRKSKYVWSDWKQCIPDIKKAISEERYILFTGTPCQAYAIRNLFGNYDKLFIVDFFCHGTAEAKFFKEYLRMLNTTVTAIDFRGQSAQENSNFDFRIWDKTGLVVSSLYEKNIFTSLYTNSAVIRQACFSCKFATQRHSSDITIGDYSFKESAKLMKIPVKHPSIVSVNTKKGKELLDLSMELLKIQELENEDEINFYYRDHNNIKNEWGYNKEIRDKFLKNYEQYGFVKASIYSLYSREMYLIEELKKIVDNDKEILLYGSGCVGKRLLSLIRQICPEWNVTCFLNSKKPKEDFMMGTPVFSADNMSFIESEKDYQTPLPVRQIDDVNILGNQIVVISVSENYMDEIEKELKNRKIKNYVK